MLTAHCQNAQVLKEKYAFVIPVNSDAATPSSNTPPEEESTDSSLMDDEGLPKPRKRRIHLPFGKKSKTPA